MEDGTEIEAGVVLSNADPKRTFLGMVDAKELPEEFREKIRGIKMAGPCAKVNMVLSEEPRFMATPAGAPPQERSLFTLVKSLEFAERCYDIAKFGEIPEELWVDCVVASNVDDSLAPAGKHIMTCFVQYVPYRLAAGKWDENRDLLARRVVKKIAEFAPNVPGAIEAMQVITPLDLERTYGLTEGNIFHGDLNLEQLFFLRPVAGWAQYRTPIEGLYLCGAGAHPGGGVTGAPGHNAAKQVIRDYRGRKRRSSRKELMSEQTLPIEPAVMGGAAAASSEVKPPRVMGLADLVMFYVVTGVSLRWIATAASAGPSSIVVWGGAWLCFYVPLALSVLELSARYPQEGGLYVWSKKAFGDFSGFMSGMDVLDEQSDVLSVGLLFCGEQCVVCGRDAGGGAVEQQVVLHFCLRSGRWR